MSSNNPKLPLLNSISTYLEKLFGVFGLSYTDEGKQTSERDVHIMNVLSKFRDQIRANSKSDSKKILEICDEVRDYDLVELGIRIEDRKPEDPSLWK